MKMNTIIARTKTFEGKSYGEGKNSSVENSKFEKILADKSEKKELFIEKKIKGSSNGEEKSVEEREEEIFAPLWQEDQDEVQTAQSEYLLQIPVVLPSVEVAGNNLQTENDSKTDLIQEQGKTNLAPSSLQKNGDPINPTKSDVPLKGHEEDEFLKIYVQKQIEEGLIFRETKIVKPEKTDGESQKTENRFEQVDELQIPLEIERSEHSVPEVSQLRVGEKEVSLKVGDTKIHMNQKNYPEELAAKIHFEFSEGKSTFRINLAPEHLGNVNVELSVTGDEAVIQVITETEEAYRLFTSDKHILRHALQNHMDSKSEVVILWKEQSPSQTVEQATQSREDFSQSGERGSQNSPNHRREKEEDIPELDFNSDFKMRLEG